MEGWLYGLFTLFGVILGGLFSYLGMRQQLKQRSEIDSRTWRREVRSKPLLKLREELAYMASMQNRIIDLANEQRTRDDEAKEKVSIKLQDAFEDWDTYLARRDLVQTLFVQYDSELFNKVYEIQESYIACYYKFLNKAEQEEAIKSWGKTWPKVIEAQELINKRLEEL